jgi:hypothetical protein
MNITKREYKGKRRITNFWSKLIERTKGVISSVKQTFQKGVELFNGKIAVVGQRLSCTKGISTIEIILIIVVFIALIIIFRDRLMTLMNSIFDTITSESGSV